VFRNEEFHILINSSNWAFDKIRKEDKVKSQKVVLSRHKKLSEGFYCSFCWKLFETGKKYNLI